MTNSKKDINVLALFGSPRKKGNSTLLANRIILGAESQGATIESVYLNGLNIKPCQGCYACQKEDSKGCAVDDDMQNIYPKIIEADALIIASPVYWFTMSAQTKIFMDRCIAMYNEDNKKSRLYGKNIAIAMTYGDKDAFSSGCINALRTFQDAYNFVGADIAGMVYGSAEEPGEIAANEELMQDAEALGKKLVSTCA
ncbi:flavodoxin family protein [Desulfobacterales bacterium HSG16]|nr:flavodoxin family protein [Desulfobacterales bacterium HSG16]